MTICQQPEVSGCESQLTDRTKVAHEEGLLPVFDAARHYLVCHEDGRDASEGQNEEAENEEAAHSDASDFRHLELLPRDDCADVHEAAEVKYDVETTVDFVMSLLCFFQKYSIPVERISSNETSQEVIGAQHAAYTDCEKLHNICQQRPLYMKVGW